VGDNDDFWDDVLRHIRHRVLVPVVGPDLTVAKVSDTEQTLTTLIGRRLAEHLAEKYSLPGANVNRLFANERAAVVGGYPRWGFVSLS
jgi:hypothetical protein